MYILFLLLTTLFTVVAQAQYYDNFSDGNITKNPQWFSSCIDAKVVSYNGVNGMEVKLKSEGGCTEGSIRTASLVGADTDWSCRMSVSCGGGNAHYVDYFMISSLLELGSARGLFVRIDTYNRQFSFINTYFGEETLLCASPMNILPEGEVDVFLSVINSGGVWHLECFVEKQLVWTDSVAFVPDYESLTSGIRLVDKGGSLPCVVVWQIGCGDSATDDDGLRPGDLVFTEIMFDPTPQKSLPDAEWIELYNNTDSTLSLKGCSLQSESKNGYIAEGDIAAGEYAILCSEKAAWAMLEVLDINVVLVDGMPPLRNDGGSLRLYDSTGELIASVKYEGKWLKADGGISIEKRDIHYLIDDSRNWGESVDIKGGTPGRKNSIEAEVVDTLQPMLVGVEATDSRHLTLLFSKPMSEFYDVLLESEPQIVSAMPVALNEVALGLATELDSMLATELFISGLSCINGYILPDTTLEIALPQKAERRDVLFNEIMTYVDDNQTKYIELLNNSSKFIGLADLRFCSPDANGYCQKYKVVSKRNLILAPQQMVLVAAHLDMLQCSLGHNIQSVYLESSLPSMPAKGGKLVLCDKDGQLIDSLAYSADMHHHALRDKHNVSLERTSSESGVSESYLWQSASSECGYNTAGWPNSEGASQNTAQGPVFSCDTEYFTPNADGYNDRLEIKYVMPESGYQLTADVYTRSGQHVCRVVDNQLLSASGAIVWDGTDVKGRLIEDGVYVILFRVCGTRGKVFARKLTVVKS